MNLPVRPLLSLNLRLAPATTKSVRFLHSSAVLSGSGSSKAKSKAKAKAKPTKSSFLLSSLPTAKVDQDGKPAQPLEPWSEQKPPSSKKGKSRASPVLEITPQSQTTDFGSHSQPEDAGYEPKSSVIDEEAEIARAIAEGVIPDTDLSKEIFINWLRFPDCVLLTRVGKFYESYFEPARQLSNVLNIKLASKSYTNRDTKESRQFPFAGFPVPALDKYLKILVQDLGHTVVLVEEYDDQGSIASLGKKLTASPGAKERRVYRVVTPGTMVDEGWLDGKESRYLLAIALAHAHDEPTETSGSLKLSLAYTDPSTGEFFTKETTLVQMEDELARIAPREVVLDRSLSVAWIKSTTASIKDRVSEDTSTLFGLFQVLGVHVSFADPHHPPPLWNGGTLPADVSSRPKTPEGVAIALLRHHLQYALRESTPTLTQPSRQSDSEQMQIDAATLQALEIRHALRPGGLVAVGERQASSPISSRGTLLSVISKTMTQSGHRLLIRTLTAPSTSLQLINSRLALVQSFVEREELRAELRDVLRNVGDVMRIIQRFRSQRGDGRDIWDVGRWVRTVEQILRRIEEEVAYEKSTLSLNPAHSEGLERLQQLVDGFKPLSDLVQVIEGAIDEAAIMHGTGVEGEGEEELEGIEAAGDALVAGVDVKASGKETKESKKDKDERERQEREDRQWWILPSFSTDIKGLHDELASIQAEKDQMQADLALKLDAPSLRLCKGVRYGCHIQLERADTIKVLQANALESIGGTSSKTGHFAYGPWAALGARKEITIEMLGVAQRRASRDLMSIVVERGEEIRRNAELVDEMDLTLSFAQNAVEMGWVRPELDDSTELHIVDGRHPSIESSLLQSSRNFTPNSTHMTPSSHLHILTGPNQGGKSTLLRQTAVIAILAQSGSFVPAHKARLGLVDRMFSRVGARDDLWRDRSTFMLEMVETAAILQHATGRSLVIMDEIGRGTTLQAGISIAYATLDHILRHVGCRTLFATHYHELGGMLQAERPISPKEQVDRSDDGGARPRSQAHGRETGGISQVEGREGVSFWCTDVDEVQPQCGPAVLQDGAFSYSYKLRPGINHDSHAIKAARLAGMPDSFLQTAEATLAKLQRTGRFDPPPPYPPSLPFL